MPRRERESVLVTNATAADGRIRYIRRIRTRTLGALLVGFLLAVGVVSAVVVSRSYGPLEFTGGGIAGGDEPGKAVVIDPEGIRNVPVLVIDARESGEHVFEFDLTNTGRLPLTIEGLEQEDPPGYVSFTKVEIATASANDGAGAGVGGTIFRPAEGAALAAGETRGFRVTVAYTFCEVSSPGAGSSGYVLPLRYGYGPFSRTGVTMPLDLQIQCGPLPAGE
jgi:hypothetical protein